MTQDVVYFNFEFWVKRLHLASEMGDVDLTRNYS
uniref:Uncharacterized protein n=1 Tax=Anguilla anguilla TaxID=7936 RepID=A0A0E9Q491_ANGAN